MTKHLSILISFSLAILYVLGLTLQQSYLGELGVPESQFALPVDRIFFQGFFLLIHMGGKELIKIFLIATGVLLLAQLFVLATHLIGEAKVKKVVSIFKTDDKQEKDSFLDFSYKVFLSVMLLLATYLAVLLLLISIEHVGSELGKTFIQNTQEKKAKEKEIKIKGRPAHLSGYTIICNTGQCAYYIDGKTLILSHQDIDWVKTK